MSLKTLAHWILEIVLSKIVRVDLLFSLSCFERNDLPVGEYISEYSLPEDVYDEDAENLELIELRRQAAHFDEIDQPNVNLIRWTPSEVVFDSERHYLDSFVEDEPMQTHEEFLRERYVLGLDSDDEMPELMLPAAVEISPPVVTVPFPWEEYYERVLPQQDFAGFDSQQRIRFSIENDVFTITTRDGRLFRLDSENFLVEQARAAEAAMISGKMFLLLTAIFYCVVMTIIDYCGLMKRKPTPRQTLLQIIQEMIEEEESRYATIGGKNKSKYKDKPLGLFLTHDGNPVNNRDRILRKKFLSFVPLGGSFIHLGLFGCTQCDRGQLDFPVYCDKKQFLEQVMPEVLLMSKEDFAIFRAGIMNEKNSHLFHRILSPQPGEGYAMMGYFDRFDLFVVKAKPWVFHVLCVLFCAYFDNSLAVMASVFLNRALINLYGFENCVLLAPIHEEIAKVYVGCWQFGLYEMMDKLVSLNFSWKMFQPFLLHVFTGCFSSIWIRVLIHFSWNLSRIVVDSPLCCAMFTISLNDYDKQLQTMEEFTKVADLIRKILLKDIAGAFLDVLKDTRWYLNMVTILGESIDISALWEFIPSAFASKEEVTGLEPESSSRISFFIDRIRTILPKWISHSPVYAKITALIVLLTSSTFVTSSTVFLRLCKFFDFSEMDAMSAAAEPLTILFGVMKGVFSGCKRVVESGSWRDFFDLPKDVYFIVESSKLLYEVEHDLTEDECLAQMAQARMLIDSRLFVPNSSEINRKLDLLRKFAMNIQTKLSDQAVRTPPFVIIMQGDPGTGKTTMNENMINYCAKLLGITRFVGDVIHYNIYDKFPISANMNKDAWVLLGNDLCDNYKDFPMKDLMPFDVFVQQIFDTAPLCFRSAAVEDKGRMYNKIRLVIFTCNKPNFVCPGPVEKLQRRLENGVLVEMQVKVNGKLLQHAEFSKLTPGERNSNWVFTIKDINCHENHVMMTNSQTVYRLDTYLQYVTRRLLAYEEKMKSEKDLFFNSSSRCECGCAIAFHRMKVDRHCVDVLDTGNPSWGTDAWFSNSNACDSFIKDYNKEHGLTTSIKFFNREHTTLMNKKVLLYSTSIFMSFVGLFFGFIMSSLISFLILTLSFQAMNYLSDDKIDAAYLGTMKVISKVNDFLDVDPILRCQLLAQEQFLQLKLWCRQKLKILLALCGASGVLMLMNYWMKKNLKVTGLATPIFLNQVDSESMVTTNFRQQASFPEEKRREWAKTDTVMNRVDLMTLGTSMSDLEVIVRNQLQSSFLLREGCEGKGTIRVQFLLLSADFFVINRHYLFDGAQALCHRFTLFAKGVPHIFMIKDMMSDISVEWIMFRHSMPYICRNLANYFPKDPCRYGIDILRVSNAASYASVAEPKSQRFHGILYDTLEWKDELIHGDCMSVVIGKFHSGVGIVGFVFYGLDDSQKEGYWTRVGASVTSQEVFARMVSHVVEPIVSNSTFLGGSMAYVPVDEHSDVRNVESAYIDVIGTEPGATNHFRSSKKKSRWYDHFAPRLSKPFDAPKKVSGMKDGEYKSAFMHTMDGHGKGAEFPIELGLKAADSFLDDCFPETFVKERGIKASPLKFEEALFGAPEMNISKLCFTTSCGMTCREKGIKNKYDLFCEVEPGFYKFRPDVLQQVETVIGHWARGTLVYPRAEFVAKDEIKSVESLEIFKVRLFSNIDVESNLPTRMMTMAIVILFLMYPRRTECYGGMNAGSKEWDEFATYILHEDFLQMDMDFICFDSSHGMFQFRVVAYFVYKFCLRVGYTQEMAYVAYICVRSGQIQLMRYVLTWFIKYGGLSSGWILTLFFNSVMNSILMRMAFDVLVEDLSKGNFQKLVRVGTVGDDNASGVHKSIAASFNLKTIAPLYLKWGYRVTTAKKDKELSEFVDPKDLQFVKRNFVYSEDLKGYVAPLAKDSIYKSLCFEDKKIGVTPVQRLVDVALGAQREAFLHGRKFFDEFQADLKICAEASDVPVRYLDYVNLVLEYNEDRFSTFDC